MVYPLSVIPQIQVSRAYTILHHSIAMATEWLIVAGVTLYCWTELVTPTSTDPNPNPNSRYSNHPIDQYSRREGLVATYYTAGCCSSLSLSLFAFLIVVFTLIELAHSMACTIYISKIKRHLVEKMSVPFPTSNKIKVLEEVSTGNYFINQS